MAGSRSGGIIAATWASMMNHGQDGYVKASEASSFACLAIFIIASKSRREGLSPELCCDLAELMISPDEDVESAGVPSDLRVSIVVFFSFR